MAEQAFNLKRTGCVQIVLLIAAGFTGSESVSAADFESQVAPLLIRRCLECLSSHGTRLGPIPIGHPIQDKQTAQEANSTLLGTTGTLERLWNGHVDHWWTRWQGISIQRRV